MTCVCVFTNLLLVLRPHVGVPQPLRQGVDLVVEARGLDLVIGLQREKMINP